MALWSPSNLNATLTAWQQGGTGVSVSSWTDSSGNSNDLAQSVSGDQPAVATINGLDVLDFTRSENDHMDYGDLDAMDVGSGDFYTFIVINPETIGSNMALFAKNNAADDYLLQLAVAGTVKQYIASSKAGFVTGATVLSAGTTNIVSGYRKSSINHVRVNGTADGNTLNGNAISNSNELHVAGQGPTGGLANFDGKIGEIILGGGTIETEEIEKVEGYLAERFALTSLPSSHSYKQHPPTEYLEISGTQGDIESGLTLSVSSELTTVRI